tara:strand:+ start:645 stop:1247 length:603 start_codon:yes stop_codon:yes gene_type:complete
MLRGSFINEAFNKGKETFIGQASDAASDAASSDEAQAISSQASDDLSSNESLQQAGEVTSFKDGFKFVLQMLVSSSIGIAITALFLYVDQKFTGAQPNVAHIKNVLMMVGGISLALFLFGGTIIQVIIPMLGKKGKEGAEKVGDEAAKNAALQQAISDASSTTSSAGNAVDTVASADVAATADSAAGAAADAAADNASPP